MAGLLDGAYSPDPLSMGLLGLGSALMTPRAMGGGVGAGMQAFAQQSAAARMARQQMRRQAEQDALARKLFDLKLSEATETAEDRKRKREMEKSLQKAAQDAYRPAMPGVGDENNPYVPVADTPARFDRQQFVNNLYGAGMPGEAMRIEDSLKQDSPFGKIDPSKFTPDSVRAFVASGGRDFGVLRQYEVPEKVDRTPMEKALIAAGIDPRSEEGQKYLRAYATKTATHAPAASQTVYTGTMVPVERTDGTPGYVMPSKDGTVLPLPGVQPPGTAKAKEASEANTRTALDRSKLMLDKIDSALGKVGFGTTAIPGAVMGKVPGTGAYDLRAEVETIKANFGFQELQQMRASSPTGGALGQVAVQELAMLQAAVQNLDPNQSPAQLRRNLDAAKKHVTNWRNAVQMSAGRPGAAATQQRSPDGRTVTGTIGAAPTKSIDDLLKQYGD